MGGLGGGDDPCKRAPRKPALVGLPGTLFSGRGLLDGVLVEKLCDFVVDAAEHLVFEYAELVVVVAVTVELQPADGFGAVGAESARDIRTGRKLLL